jgi:hypothetical protein
MATKSKAATNGNNGHVSLAREEYSAFLAREESFNQLFAEHERYKINHREVMTTCDAQAKHLAMRDLTVTHLERLVELQQQFLDLIRDGTKVASVEELSEFWHQWQLHTHKGVEDKKFDRSEVMKYEPDLFKSWRAWVNDAGKKDRRFSEAGTRSERDAMMPPSPKELQEHIIVRLRQDNAGLANRVLALEAEMEKVKSEKPQDNQPQEKKR